MRETSELFSQLVRGQTMKRECDRTELSAGQDNPEGQWREKGFVCLRWKLSRFPEDTMLCSWGPHSDFSRSRITDKLLSFPILLFSLLLFPEDRRTKKLPTPRSKQLSQLFSSSILEISILPSFLSQLFSILAVSSSLFHYSPSLVHFDDRVKKGSNQTKTHKSHVFFSQVF